MNVLLIAFAKIKQGERHRVAFANENTEKSALTFMAEVTFIMLNVRVEVTVLNNRYPYNLLMSVEGASSYRFGVAGRCPVWWRESRVRTPPQTVPSSRRKRRGLKTGVVVRFPRSDGSGAPARRRIKAKKHTH